MVPFFRPHGRLWACLRVVAVLAPLAACGGGGDDGEPLDPGRTVATAPSGAGPAERVATAAANTLQLVSERAAGGALVDRVYRVRFQNSGPAQSGVVATLLSAGSQAMVVSGRIAIGAMPAGAVLLPADTVTLRQPRGVALDVASWRWAFSAAGPAAEPSAAPVPTGLAASPLPPAEALPTAEASPEDQARFH